MDFYEQQLFDFRVVKGDTANLKFEFYDNNGIAINEIKQWNSKFTLRDPITDEPILALQKIHNDVAPSGAGIYYNGDIYAPLNIGITADNQLVVILSDTDTTQLSVGAYPFDIEFYISQAYSSRYTPIRGNLIVLKEHTPNV